MSQRKQLLVDGKVQGTLLCRVISYWGFCLLTITLMLLSWRMVSGPPRSLYQHVDEMWYQFGPVFIAACLAVPLVVYDVLLVSHRFAGPLYRLRREMRRLERGEQVQPMHFREGDFWHDIAASFNGIAERCNQLTLASDKTSALAEALDEEELLTSQ